MTRLRSDLIFVYGTLRKGRDGPVREVLDRHCEFLADATVRGRLYEVDGYPGLVESPEAKHAVVGELYRMTSVREVLSAIDDYEQCSERFPPPHEYARKVLPVNTAGGVVDAWVYVYMRPTGGLQRIESGDYLCYARERSGGQH